MEGLVEKLLRLEGAKHKALVEIDALAYNATVRKQMRLLATPRKNLSRQFANLDRLLALSQLITLNRRLLQNLASTTPGFALPTAASAKQRTANAGASRTVRHLDFLQ